MNLKFLYWHRTEEFYYSKNTTKIAKRKPSTRNDNKKDPNRKGDFRKILQPNCQRTRKNNHNKKQGKEKIFASEDSRYLTMTMTLSAKPFPGLDQIPGRQRQLKNTRINIIRALAVN